MSQAQIFQARLALVDYAKSKITDHIGYVISIFVLVFALYSVSGTESPVEKFLMAIRDYVLILLLGPLVYMFGRLLYWSSYLDGVMMVKIAHPSTFNPEDYFMLDKVLKKGDFSFNTIWGLNRNASRAAARRKGLFGKFGKYFIHSKYLMIMTGFSILAVYLYWIFVGSLY